MADPKKPSFDAGLITTIPKGRFGNPMNLSTKFRPTFTDDESFSLLSAKLNTVQTLETYTNLRGIVVEIENQEAGGVLDALFSFFSDKETKKPPSKLAYVYIDVVHSSVQPFLNFDNFRYYLTEVPLFGDDTANEGNLIEVSFNGGDYSVGKFVKRVTDKVPRLSLTKAALAQQLCASPSVGIDTPDPASAPDNFAKDNVGYVQALYVLAKWQADNPPLYIEEIEYPFLGDSEVGMAITKLLKMAKETNEKILKNKSQDANSDKQWIKYVTKLIDSVVKYKDNPNDGRMIIKLRYIATSQSVRKIDSFTAYYTKLQAVGSKAFYLGFPQGDMRVPPTSEMLEMTQNNLASFLENFEKTYTGEGEATPTPTAQPTAQSQLCNELNQFQGEWSHDAQLSANFKVKDLDKDAVAINGTTVVTKSGKVVEISGEELTTNLKTLANWLEVIRARLIEKFGSKAEKMFITGRGGYQPSWNNAGKHWKAKPSFYGELAAGKVIGKDGNPKGRTADGNHRRGKASDIIVPGISSQDVWYTVKELMTSGKIPNGGLGYYPGFIHYDIRSSRSRWFEKNKNGQHYPKKYYKSFEEARKQSVKHEGERA
jgi:hypothetical protein